MNLLLALPLLIAATAGAAPAAGESALFAAPKPIEVGCGSGGVFLVDLDHDGHLDLVAKHLLTQRISLHLGDGRGNFRPGAAGSLPLNFAPGALAVGDVNGDRIPDLAVTARRPPHDYVYIFLGDGRGGFAQAAGTPFIACAAIDTYKPAIVLAELNGDGKPDIVVANARRDTVETFFGDGRGGFSAGPVLDAGRRNSMRAFAVGDIDGDGRVDIVISQQSEPPEPRPLLLNRGDGQGRFRAASGPSLSLPPDGGLRAMADLNGDGRRDLVFGHGHEVGVFANQGDARFSPAGPRINVDLHAWQIVVADINGDAQPDLVVATVDSRRAPFEGKVVALLGDGGGFKPVPGSPYAVGPGAYTLAVGDVNEDGRPDIVAASFESDAVSLLLHR